MTGDNLQSSGPHLIYTTDLIFDYIVYMDRVHIIEFRELLKKKFDGPRKPYLSSKAAQNFIRSYCQVMDYKFEFLSPDDLSSYNKLFK